MRNIDVWRVRYMAVAEWVDAWRIVPRIIVGGYAYMLWTVVTWYMALEPQLIENCATEILKELCVAQAPSTQHAALVTAVIGISAAVFGLYSNSGRKWTGFTPWGTKPSPKERPVDGHTPGES